MNNKQSRPRPKFGIFSIWVPFAAFLYFFVSLFTDGILDTQRESFDIFPVVEVIWYFSIVGLISGIIGITRREKPSNPSYIGTACNGMLAAFLAYAILFAR